VALGLAVYGLGLASRPWLFGLVSIWYLQVGRCCLQAMFVSHSIVMFRFSSFDWCITFAVEADPAGSCLRGVVACTENARSGVKSAKLVKHYFVSDSCIWAELLQLTFTHLYIVVIC